MALSRGLGGFRPYGQILRQTRYRVIATCVVGQGDLLTIGTTGGVRPTTATSGNLGKNIGVAAHFVTSVTTGREGKVRDCIVYDHPDQLFQVQVSGVVNHADVFNNFSLT